jgi:putative endonuclease
VLQSKKDTKFYVGRTSDLRRRFSEHQNGRVFSTRNRRPLKLVYYETCIHKVDAEKREKYLKTAWGKRYIKNRLRYYLTG